MEIGNCGLILTYMPGCVKRTGMKMRDIEALSGRMDKK